MVAAIAYRDAGSMSATATSTLAAPSDRSRTLALFGPLLLFIHGIFGWLDGRDGVGGAGWAPVLAGLTLVGAVVALTLLTAELGEQTGRGMPATLTVSVSAFGAGAVSTVTVGRLLGVLAEDLPAALTGGGPALLAIGLGLLLFRLVHVGRLRTSAAVVVVLGAAVVAAPWDLLPLGALVLLVGLAPLAHRR